MKLLHKQSALLGLIALLGAAPYLYAAQRLTAAVPLPPTLEASASGVYVAPVGVLSAGVR